MISVQQAAELLGISTRRVRVLCAEDRIPGAKQVGKVWVLPAKPKVLAADRRRPGKVSMQD